MENQKQVVKREDVSLIKSDVKLAWPIDSQAKMAEVFGFLFDGQKQFGKNSDQIENMVKFFCWSMRKYPVEKVLEGIGQYVLQKSDIPTPSDIVNIIDPKPPVWKPDKSYYISLKEILKAQGQYGLDNDEIEYIRRYEDNARFEMKTGR